MPVGIGFYDWDYGLFGDNRTKDAVVGYKRFLVDFYPSIHRESFYYERESPLTRSGNMGIDARLFLTLK